MNAQTELLNDLPLIVGFCKKLKLDELINKHFPSHASQQGLSNGELILGWITHILTTSNHCKAPVNDWMYQHKMIMQALLEKRISDTDFEDCRLGRLLDKFALDQNWHGFEKSFYANSFSILQLNTSLPEEFSKAAETSEKKITRTIKVDSTTAYGHHEVYDGGIMQYGMSKDHRPDLPQLKIMVSVEGNTGYQIATDLHSGNRCDDILYMPIIERTREIVPTKNCLFCGDSKMSNLSTKANLEKNNEFYLVPVQMNKTEKKEMERLVNKIVNEDQEAHLIYDLADCAKGTNKIIGAGYELERNVSFQDDLWNERVLLVRSFDHVNQEVDRFLRGINKIKEKLIACTSKLCISPEEAKEDILDKIKKLNEKESVIEDLFEYTILCEAEEKSFTRSEVRNGKTRNGNYTLKKYRAKVVNVIINAKKQEEIKRKTGWRIYVTNAPRSTLNFSNAYRFYRKTMYVIEIGFHVLKDYLQISPLFVRDPNQILGLTRVLLLALKILTLITAEIRENIKKEKVVLTGLYAGQPARKHPSPTAQSLLEYFSRQGTALIGIKIEETWHWQITPLSVTCQKILGLLKIPEEYFTSIPEKLKKMGYIF